jgi:hypothetical protein
VFVGQLSTYEMHNFLTNKCIFHSLNVLLLYQVQQGIIHSTPVVLHSIKNQLKIQLMISTTAIKVNTLIHTSSKKKLLFSQALKINKKCFCYYLLCYCIIVLGWTCRQRWVSIIINHSCLKCFHYCAMFLMKPYKYSIIIFSISLVKLSLGHCRIDEFKWLVKSSI